MRERGLGVANCVPAIPSFLQLALPGMEGPADPAERVAALCASVTRLARFEPASVICLSGPVGERSEEEARALVRDGLRQVAAAARTAGVRLGLEPTHLSESGETSFLSSIGEAIALLDEAGLDDVGVMVDSVHVWDTPGLAAEIALHASRITGLHVADKVAPGAPGRVLPGEGVTHPELLVGLMGGAGFDGYLDIEIFSTPEAFWGLPVEEAARARSRRGAFADRAIMSAMDFRALGTTGLQVSRIALGCGNFGGVGSAPEFYGQGETETQALALMDARVGRRHQRLRHGRRLRRRAQRDVHRQAGSRAKGSAVRDRLVLSIEGLQPGRRRPERARPLARAHLPADRREPHAPRRPIGSTCTSCHEPDPDDADRGDARRARRPRRAGKVQYIGASNIEAWRLARGLWVSDVRGLARFDWVQNRLQPARPLGRARDAAAVRRSGPRLHRRSARSPAAG